MKRIIVQEELETPDISMPAPAPTPEAGLQAADPVGAEHAEADMACHDVQESSNIGQQHAAAIDSATAHMGACVDMHEALQGADHVAAIPADVSTHALEALQTVIKGFTRHLGGNPASVSMESHADPKERSKIAMETMLGTIKSIWEKIAAALKAAWDWFVDFMKNIFNAASRLSKRAQALEKVLMEMKDGVADTTDITDTRLLRYVRPTRGMKSADVVAKYFDQCKLLSMMLKCSFGYMKEAEDKLEGMITFYNEHEAEFPGSGGAEETVKNLLNHYVTPVYAHASFWTAVPGCREDSSQKRTEPENTRLFRLDLPFEGSYFYARILGAVLTEDQQLKALAHVGYGIKHEATDKIEAAGVEPLARAEAIKICRAVEVRMKQITDARQEINEIGKAFKSFDKMAKKSVTGGEKELNGKISLVLSRSGAILSRMATMGERSLRAFEIQAGSNMLVYAAHSAKQMLAKEEVATPEAPLVQP